MTASCDGMHVVISDLVFFIFILSLYTVLLLLSLSLYTILLMLSFYVYLMYISNKLKLHLEQSHEVQYVQVW